MIFREVYAMLFEAKGGVSFMQKTSLRKRDLYLNRIIAFQDTEMIKVMTGIRRCGKSREKTEWSP